MAYADLQGIHNPATGNSPPAAWGDQARDNDEYLYNRGPYICTSATRPGSPFEGQQIFETDTNKTLIYDGANWWTTAIAGNGTTSYTSALMVDQAGTATHTATVSEYRIISGVCEWWFNIAVTGSGGGAGNTLTLLLPVTASAASNRHLGAGSIYDSSIPTWDSGSWELTSTSRMGLVVGEGTNASWGNTPSVSIASGDAIRGHVRFLVASAA